MSHLFNKDRQTFPQRVKSSDRTCVVISMKRDKAIPNDLSNRLKVSLKHGPVCRESLTLLMAFHHIPSSLPANSNPSKMTQALSFG